MFSLHPELTGWFLDPTEAVKPAGLAPTCVLLLAASGFWCCVCVCVRHADSLTCPSDLLGRGKVAPPQMLDFL